MGVDYFSQTEIKQIEMMGGMGLENNEPTHLLIF